MRWLWLTLLVAGVAIAAPKNVTLPPENGPPTVLQPPILSKGETGEPQQAKPSDNPAPTQPDQRGTKNAPISVEITNASELKPEPSPDAKTRNEHATPEGWVSPEWTLNILTAALVIVGAVQIGVFVRQARALHDTIIKMDEIATKQGADTATSIKESARSAKAMEDSVAATGREYVASHRPRLVTRGFRNLRLNLGQQPSLQYYIVNIGDTRATIIERHCLIAILDEPGGVFGLPQLSDMVTDMTVTMIENGAEYPVVFSQAGNVAAEDIEAINANIRFLHIVGFIVYKDENGTMRRMGFFRYYDAERRRFRVIDDPDYEYSD